MGYDETLATKIHSLLSAIGPCERGGMHGTVTFTVNGNIAAGVEDSNVFLRIGEGHAAELLKIQGIKPWPLEGRASRGWVLLTPVAIGPMIVMRERLGWAYQCTSALPPKAVPRGAEPPRPPPPPPPPPEPVKKAARPAPRPKPAKTPASPPATTVIAPGMERPLSPPTRIPFVPTVSKTVTPLTATRAPVGVVERPGGGPAKPGSKAKAGTSKPAKPVPKQRRVARKGAKSADRQTRKPDARRATRRPPAAKSKTGGGRKKSGKGKKR
jgi:hypothetical protein